jgi:hypothetical protein
VSSRFVAPPALSRNISLLDAWKKTGTQPRFADRFQDPDRADAGDVGCVFRNIEAHAHVALCAEMINLLSVSIRKEASPD